MSFRKKWKLYELICKYPDLGCKEISEKIGWNMWKVRYYTMKLIREGLIKDYYKSVKVGDLINWDEMEMTER